MTCRWCGSKRARTEPILRWRNPMHVEAGRQCVEKRACERRRFRAKLDERRKHLIAEAAEAEKSANPESRAWAPIALARADELAMAIRKVGK